MSLFNRPKLKKLGDVDVEINLLTWEYFEDALAVGTWMQSITDMMPTLDDLQQLGYNAELRASIDRLIACCISVPATDTHEAGARTGHRISVAEVKAMPIMTLLEAMLLVMEVNLDFFLQSLQRCMQTKTRLLSTGSPSLSS